MPDFTDDLIVEIVSRLPTKPVIRFKCVSKRWNSFISDPKFATLQLKGAERAGTRLLRTTTPPQSLDYEASSSCKNNNKGVNRKLSYPAAMVKGSASDFRTSWILGSCNGLIGILGCSYGRYAGEFLWNPTTGDYKELPEAPRLKIMINLPVLYGLGYNVSSNDYGVLHGNTMTQSKGTMEPILHLYTLKTGKWRQIQDADPDLVSSLRGRSVSWNGDMFWLGRKPNGVPFLGSFDLKEEKFKEIQLPSQGHKKSSLISLGISAGNSLCVFYEGKGSCFEAWALKVDNHGASCWNILFRFPHDIKFWGHHASRPLCLTKEGEVVMDSGVIYLYNPEERKSTYFEAHNNSTGTFSVLYIESLVSPNC
ncbi:unnamed protein product [Cuscuta epithymum]|uniref:F-box domain-containing protein n=1 Tax=Cuscuta epithymum TaxID=186058 RepID=A0AAV0DQ07_9ASTE|nr:unnamed protein product [Cuscuta epithymum]CAH9143301.1 unnamed protein product [Cuscuta epithymum]